ncbi:hypothetical protein GCM10010302_64860 [Streptomyces polychromogenes]|uniref:eCIS core domain-containing protein n=1 Tax=Streptomyces polychromogenes TaxID=67342 RepID=A0ABP3FHU7_9ACTN
MSTGPSGPAHEAAPDLVRATPPRTRRTDPAPWAAVSADPWLEAEADRFADRLPAARPGAVRPLPRLDGPPPPTGSPGVPLDTATRAELEPRLGWDLTRIRLHTGPAADRSAAALGARAYTLGPHVVLGEGARPRSPDGRRLLAHELAHVAQQARGAGRGTLHLKPADTPAPARPRPRKGEPFKLVVTAEMEPAELMRAFLHQYYRTDSEAEVDRRLPWWHFDRPGGRSATAADVRRGFLWLRVHDVADETLAALPEAERTEVEAEADARFRTGSGVAPGTRLGTGAQDAALRGRLRGARADALLAHVRRREIEALPAEVKNILFGGGAATGGRPVAPEDYETVLRLGRKLGALSRPRLRDYLARTDAGTTSWTELEDSVERFLAGERARENERLRTDAAAATLFGCEDLYLLWRRRWNLMTEVSLSEAGLGPHRLTELTEADARFRDSLHRHGFADEQAFRTAIETYRLRFRDGAVALALDVLARYDHMLYEARKDLTAPGRAEALTAGIAATGARELYARADERRDLARTVRAGGDPETLGGALRAAQRALPYEAEAASLRDAADRAVVRGSGGNPLVDPERLGRATSREKLARLDAPGARAYLLGVAGDRSADTAKARAEFTYDPERVFSLPDLVAAALRGQGVDEGTVYGWIVRDHVEAVHEAHLFSAVVLGILALVLAALVPGGGWLAAAALVANTALGAQQAIEAVGEYRRQALEYRLGFLEDEPSLFWVGIAVGAAALDLGVTTATLLKASAGGLSALEGPLREFAAAPDAARAAARYETLVARIRTVEGLGPEVRAALEAAAAAEHGFRQAAGLAMSRPGMLGLLDPAWYRANYHLVKGGVKSLTAWRKDARLLELMGDVTRLTGAQRAELTTAFERIRTVVAVAERRAMDPETALRFVDRLAAERAGGEGAFEALVEEMSAWRPPTAEQRQAEKALAEAGGELARLREEHAGLTAERAALRREPAATRDTERIFEINDELYGTRREAGLEDQFRTDRSGVSRPHRPGRISEAERALWKAEAAAERARVDPTTRMRQVFGASRERTEVVASATADQVGALRTRPQGVAVDHVVSLKRIARMEGFDRLTAAERGALAVRRDNLVLMDASANSSKGERAWSAWRQASAFYGEADVVRWTARDAELARTIQEWILSTVRGR